MTIANGQQANVRIQNLAGVWCVVLSLSNSALLLLPRKLQDKALVKAFLNP